MTTIFSIGLGIGTKSSKGDWLEVFYPAPAIKLPMTLLDPIKKIAAMSSANQAVQVNASQMQQLAEAFKTAQAEDLATTARQLAASSQNLVLTVLETDAAPTSTPEVYLKLHLLSHRLVKPHQMKLDGMFSLLPNVAWTNEGAIDITELPQRQLQARLQGKLLDIHSVDKFPKMTNYVVPKGVRIADTSRVRLGAYLGEGTTIMHEGFVNFNAGTEGPGMIEGRISAGVYVQAGSDLGGGCSTMGTLSGGNSVIISIGRECLIGANAGVGIPLGDRCTIEAGLYITAGAVVQLLDNQGQLVQKIKARDLSGKSGLLFRRNSITGAIEVLTNKSAIELNHDLHLHN